MENSLPACDDVQTVDNFLKQVAQIHQSELWKTVQPVIKVEGTVTSVKQYPKVSYFTLAGPESSVSVKCPTTICPVKNQEIIVMGHPYFKPNKFSYGITVEIDGKPIGEVEPSNFKAPLEIDKNRYLKLNQLVSSTEFQKLMVLGSEIAIRDVLSQLDGQFMKFIDCEVVTISDKQNVVESIRGLDASISSFVLVRGGDVESLQIWNDLELIKEVVDIGKPFYVALGHTHRILGISHYADESFGTPSVFGNYLNQTFKTESHINDLESEVIDLSEKLTYTKQNLETKEGEVKQLKTQNQDITSQNQNIIDKQKSWRKKEWILIGILIVVIYYLI